jgi:PTH1 family peptidyl-tRNA hydrolase
MSWLQQKPQVSDPQMFYSIGLNKTLIIVGLGNPGDEYLNTRHNIGFSCLDYFKEKNSDLEPWANKKSLKSLISVGRVNDSRVIAVKPTTFMNLSGEAVRAVMDFYKVNASGVAVIYDDIDINFGQIRIRQNGSSAGHNGIKSITEHIGEDFVRIRVGIGPKKPERIPSEKFVLAKFSEEEMKEMSNLRQEAGSILSQFVYGTELLSETRNFIF